ncbi:MAG: hypothetical protein HQ510_09820, partial [Candidatus Marinimicrobia bacterium]|nr:hypothetical protein [Candidatus Neomarinimicrobiota bacterium]
MKKLIILSIHLVLFSVILGSDQSNFKSAQPGEYWVILDDNIAVMKTPKTQSERTAFNQHLVTIIGKNTKVNVLESTREGWFSVWHKVNVISDDGVLATGWVLAEIVKSAEKSTRSESNAFMNNWGLLRFAHSTTDIQASRNASSKVVGQLKPNQEIKVDFSKDGWWAVFDIDESYRHETNAIGYVLSPLLFPEQNEGTSATETSKQLLQFR